MSVSSHAAAKKIWQLSPQGIRPGSPPSPWPGLFLPWGKVNLGSAPDVDMRNLAEALAVAAIVGLATHANAVEMPKLLIGEWCGNVGHDKVTTFYTKDLLRLLPGTCERSFTVTKGSF